MVDVSSSLPRDPDPESGPDQSRSESLTIDCDGCSVRGLACSDCVVSVLLGPPRTHLELDTDESAAFAALAGAGLVPPLRLVRAVDGCQCDGDPPASGGPAG